MTESSKKKTDQAIIADLSSGIEEKILNAIQVLRHSGSPLYIPLLADLLIASGFDEVRKSILSLFADMKDKESVPVMVEIIENDRYRTIRKELIASCWLSGLDYSPYLPKLVSWVIENDMDIAFEAFTLIENLDHLPDAQTREAEIIRINHALRQADSLKSYLLKELRGILA